MKSNTKRFVNLVLFTGVLLVSLVGCGGGGGGGGTPAPTPTIPDANPMGYYTNTGTATVKQTDNTTDLPITDLEAMVYNNRLMMMSVVNNLMYDITISKITGNDYTGTATIYTDGQNPVANVPVTGTIITGSSISGTLTGTGAGNGTFNLIYATSNSQVAAVSRIVNTSPTWTGRIGVVDPTVQYQFGIDSTGLLYDNNPIFQGYFRGCAMDGTVSALSNTSLYSVAVTVTGCTPVASVDGDYTGLAATQDGTDVILAMTLTKTDDSHSVSGNFHR